MKEEGERVGKEGKEERKEKEEEDLSKETLF